MQLFADSLLLLPLTSERLSWGVGEQKYGTFLGGRVGGHRGEYNGCEPLGVPEDVAGVSGWMKRNEDMQKKMSTERRLTG